MLAAREQQGIDETISGDQRLAAALELGVEEGEIERRVMDDERRIANELEQLLGHLGKARLVLEEIGRQAVHRKGLGRHVTLGIDVAMERQPGGYAVEQLDAADLDHPMPLKGIETRGLGIQNDFPHANFPSDDGRYPMSSSYVVDRSSSLRWRPGSGATARRMP
jgi:hypothetical protein